MIFVFQREGHSNVLIPAHNKQEAIAKFMASWKMFPTFTGQLEAKNDT